MAPQAPLLAAMSSGYTEVFVANTLITDRRTPSATYRILRKLGKGGMAEVYLARQEGMAGFRRLAVIKKILPQFSAVPSVAEMLLDEARIAAQLSHPNIVQIYELGKEGDQYFIAMEFIDGCDLATLARTERHRNGRVPLRLTLRVVAEAAMGLDYAHRQNGLDGRPLNIVHRDVSPHNILCSKEGAVKLTDFGIAKAVGKVLVTEVGVVKGKIQYMAPEQYTGGAVDNRSDIYSLGVVLYQLSTGRLPRVSKEGNVAMKRVVDGNIPKPSEVASDYPEELEEIVMRALAHHPDDRYTDAASFRDDLLDFARRHDLLAFPKELGQYVDHIVSVMTATNNLPVVDRQAPTAAGLKAVASVIVEEQTPPKEDIERPSARPPSGETRAARPGPTLVDETMRDVQLHQSDANDHAQSRAQSSEDNTPFSMREATQPVIELTDAAEKPSNMPTNPKQPRRTAASRIGMIMGLIALVTVTMAVGYVTRTHWRRWLSSLASIQISDTSQPDLPAVGAAGAGLVDVLTNPTNATIAVDGATRCTSSPCRLAALPLGKELLITVRAPKHDLWMQRVVLTGQDARLVLRADLSPVTHSAASPHSTQSTQTTTTDKPTTPSKSSGGRLPRATSDTTEKTAASTRSAPIKSTMQVSFSESEMPDAAMLVVDVRPAWAEVWIDGKKAGFTPLQVRIDPGKHKIQLKNPELKIELTKSLTVKIGQKAKLSVTLKAPPQDPGQQGAPPAEGAPPQ